MAFAVIKEKIMKKSKILVPALGILVLSTAASITGTVAWFTAANIVNVSGFKMMAQAEDGIVIANETHTAAEHWLTTVTASHNGQISSSQAGFIPTSSANLTTWYHSNSASANDHTASSGYTSYTGDAITENGSGTGVYQIEYSTGNYKNIYLLNKFYLQSSSPSAIAGQDIYIKDLHVTSATSNSVALNKALRIGVLQGSTFCKIFAPYAPDYAPVAPATVEYTTTTTYSVAGSTSVTAVTDTSSPVVLVSNTAIPAYTDAGTNALEFSFFAYFEGEDANCKSANLVASLDELAVSFVLGNVAH